MNNYQGLIQQNIFETILKAGEIALEEQKKMKIKLKQDKSIVTNGDMAVSNFLIKSFSKILPEYKVFSEERPVKIEERDKVIVVDPIDGTESYSNHEVSWSVMIAFYDGKDVTDAFIYQPTVNKFYYAKKNNGAFLLSYKEEKWETEELSVRKFNEKNIVSTISKRGKERLKDWFTRENVDHYKLKFSAGLKATEVAEGNVDIYPCFEAKCSIWDIMPAYLITKEAGGCVLTKEPIVWDFSTKPIVYRILFSNTPNYFNLGD